MNISLHFQWDTKDGLINEGITWKSHPDEAYTRSYTYDGKDQKHTILYGTGEKRHREVHEYNERAQLIRRVYDRDNDMQIDSINNYTYNTQGLLTKSSLTTYLDGNVSIGNSTSYHYMCQ